MTVTRDARPLDVRLADYRDAMALIPAQLQDVIDRMPPGTDVQPLKDAMAFYTHVGVDLTNLLNGEALRTFRIEGEIPT